ncbi:hypothetical protein Poly51_52770 [Rubripirellula tenax]|uniref:Cytochrome c domain-containing protein n=1 Tax=Rubripirellula tenax TaxID=2528015 RepID=A0A5C6EHF3_9BACT|nr:hypothetical protein [Rubripirellula tenax]TWU47477.1 hypothetical protein Poly51_52770 [Rubripirellula tenax]
MAKRKIKREVVFTIALGAFTVLPISASDAQSPTVGAGIDSVTRRSVALNVDRPCVLLHNGNVLFGQAHQLGQFVVIRDGNASEVQLPRQDVACWANSLRDLYRYRVDHRTRDDVSNHLADAQWCIRYDLFDLAAKEWKAAKSIDPNHPLAHSIEAQITRATRQVTRSVPVVQTPEVDQVSHDAEVDMSGVDLQMLRFFATNIQPTLINRCGNCHASEVGRPWSMDVPGAGSRASSRMTRENLSATLSFVDRDSPLDSELLSKAVSAHGGTTAPLDPRHAKAVEAIKIWLTAVARSGGGVSSDTYVAQRPVHAAETANVVDEIAIDEDIAVDPSPEEIQAIENRRAPARLPQVADPFSPDLFNRRH